MSAAEPCVPTAVIDHARSGVLELRWSDGRTSHLPHLLLRTRCRCAACRQHLHAHGREPPAPVSLRLAGIEAVGAHGLNLRFSDGHDRGIYPWPWLREIADALERDEAAAGAAAAR